MDNLGIFNVLNDSEVSPAGHVPLQCGILGTSVCLCQQSSIVILLLWLQLLPLSRANVNWLQVNLILSVLNFRSWIPKDSQIQSTSKKKVKIILLISFYILQEKVKEVRGADGQV